MESFDNMQKRHRTEQKNLQARITQKKKSATKKTRKGILTECEELETQLSAKQERERESLDYEAVQENENLLKQNYVQESIECESKDKNLISEPPNVDGIIKILKNSTLSSDSMSPGEVFPKKRNRQRERLARRAAERDAIVQDAEKEAANQPNKKTIEQEKILDQCSVKGLTEKSIRPDGHCLFSAVADQLTQVGILILNDTDNCSDEAKYKIVRNSAATYIDEHPDEFAAWLEEPLADYVEKIRNTAEWGGHLELLALARFYNVMICVLQDGSPQTIEPFPDANTQPSMIWLSYYRYSFGLGEHYNSLRIGC